ncbi:MAG: Ig-like domain repeat protein, partial [Dokdonella sp.]
DGVASDLFGASVSIAGDNIAVGAPGRASSRGAVYTFNRSGTAWTQGTVLTASDGAAGAKFGFSVSVRGTTIVAGAPYSTISGKTNVGSAYAFASLDGGVNWTEQYHMQVATGQARAGDHLGWSVALSGNTALVGAPDDDFGNKTDAGSVYVFVRNGSVWSKQARINPGATAGNRVGASVGLFSNTAVFGADGANNSRGLAYIYSRSGTSWSLLNTVTASDGASGDHFGASVRNSGSLVVIGAPLASAGSGKSYLYGLVGATYQELAMLVATDNAAGDHFGTGVSIDAGRALVGAPMAGSNAGNGAAYVFLIAPATTTTIGTITPEPSVAGQNYSVSVSVATNPSGLGTPTGTVDVSDGDSFFCTATLVSGAGSCTSSSSSAGVLTISADYTGGLLFGASTGFATHTVTAAGTTTTITSATPDPSLVGQTVNVFVDVAAVAPGAGTPTGAVVITDSVDPTVTCTIADISLSNSCSVSFNIIGSSTLTAVYVGDAGYTGSTSAPVAHTVTIPSGNHLVFGTQPSDVLRGNKLGTVTVEIQDATNTVVSSDNTTQVTLSLVACGSNVTFGPVTVVAGVATFTGVGPRFYTLATGLNLDANAAGYPTVQSSPFNVIFNPELIFADGFEICRL